MCLSSFFFFHRLGSFVVCFWLYGSLCELFPRPFFHYLAEAKVMSVAEKRVFLILKHRVFTFSSESTQINFFSGHIDHKI